MKLFLPFTLCALVLHAEEVKLEPLDDRSAVDVAALKVGRFKLQYFGEKLYRLDSATGAVWVLESTSVPLKGVAGKTTLPMTVTGWKSIRNGTVYLAKNGKVYAQGGWEVKINNPDATTAEPDILVDQARATEEWVATIERAWAKAGSETDIDVDDGKGGRIRMTPDQVREYKREAARILKNLTDAGETKK